MPKHGVDQFILPSVVARIAELEGRDGISNLPTLLQVQGAGFAVEQVQPKGMPDQCKTTGR